jgi:hypothetical protein
MLVAGAMAMPSFESQIVAHLGGKSEVRHHSKHNQASRSPKAHHLEFAAHGLKCQARDDERRNHMLNPHKNSAPGFGYHEKPDRSSVINHSCPAIGSSGARQPRPGEAASQSYRL